jgi:hypothetical protein
MIHQFRFLLKAKSLKESLGDKLTEKSSAFDQAAQPGYQRVLFL